MSISRFWRIGLGVATSRRRCGADRDQITQDERATVRNERRRDALTTRQHWLVRMRSGGAEQ
jgi:hypothetical protein